MALDGLTVPDPPRDRVEWQVWSCPAPPGEVMESAPGVRCHDSRVTLVTTLARRPQDPLALHSSTSLEDAEAILKTARQQGWEGAWAATREWLEAHPRFRELHGPVLEIDSWNEFLVQPWFAVGRCRPLAAEVREAAAQWAHDRLPVALAVVWQGSIVVANRSFCSLLRKLPEQLEGVPFAVLWSVPSESRPVVECLGRGAAHGREQTFEARWQRHDQQDVWVDLRCRPMEEPQLPGGWIVAAHDVSRHQRTSELLQIQRSLVESAQDGIAIVDIAEDGDQRLVFVNSAWEKLTGYSAEEALGRHPGFLQNDERDQPGAHTLRRAIASGTSANATLRNFRKDGTVYHSEITVYPLPGRPGQSLRYVGIKRDVTEKVETELRLMESERRFRHVFSDNRLPMVLVDSANGAILDANPAASDFYGYSRFEFSSLRIRDLLGEGKGGTRAASEVRGTVAVPAQGGLSQRHRMRDGSIRDVLVYSGELQTGEGRVRYVIVVDVTAQRRAEAQLLAAMDAAEAANVAKSEFLQVVGHEIRTPMNAVVGFAELLQSAESEEERDDSLAMILQGTRQLTNVLDSVVDYIGWNSDLARAPDEQIELLEFGYQCVQLWAPRAEEKGLTFDLCLPDVDRPVWMPVSDYSRILDLLCDNAIKFTEEGGVTLELEWSREGTEVIVRITDTGIGISPAVRKKLFQPFGSGDEGIRRIYGGLGLGLARAQRMAQCHGGELSCPFRPEGEGSIFEARLPFRTKE